MKGISDRVMAAPPSKTLAVTSRARQLLREGKDIIRLSSGDPDFSTPSHIIEAAYQAMREGYTHYLPVRGLEILRESVAKKARTENGIIANPDTEIVIVPSAKNGLYSTIQAVVNPGDEVLVPEPCWVSYAPQVILAGGRPVAVELNEQNDYVLNYDVLCSRYSHRTKAVVLSNPCNPTGRVLSTEELNELARFSKDYDLWVISDEIYEKIIFDDNQHKSIAAFTEMGPRTITINGLSKAYAMTGWRIGYVIGPPEISNSITKINEHNTGCANAFTQVAAVEALERSMDFIEQARLVYQRRRNLMYEGLNKIPGWRCNLSQGTFYLFPNIESTGLTGGELARVLLKEAGVAITPGSAFGKNVKYHVRISLTVKDEVLQRALGRISDIFR